MTKKGGGGKIKKASERFVLSRLETTQTAPAGSGGQKEDAMRTISNMNKSLCGMIGVAVVAVLIVLTFTACGGSPTEPKPDPTPVPTPTPRPAMTFTFTLSTTEVTPKEVSAMPGDTIKFVSVDPKEPHQIHGNVGELTGPALWPTSMGGPTEWSTTMVDYGVAKELTFYDATQASNANYFGKIRLGTKF